MKRRFRWDRWNEDHIDRHNVTKNEAEYVGRHGKPPFPQEIGHGKFLVRGQTAEGRYLQIIYILRNDEEIDYERLSLADMIELTDSDEPMLYIIHARDLTAREKAKLRH